MNQPRDKGLNGNEKIEQAVAALQQEPTQEQLAHTLTVIRRRIKEHGQLVVAVEPNLGSEQMQLRAIRTADGASWWYAFTSFEEELKGAEPVQSTFLVDIQHRAACKAGQQLLHQRACFGRAACALGCTAKARAQQQHRRLLALELWNALR